MPFGLMNASAMFQHMAAELFCELHFFGIYIDDVIICSDDGGSHCFITIVCERIRLAGLKLKLKKCSFAVKQVEALGHIVSAKGVATDCHKIERKAESRVSESENEFKSFLEFCSFFRKFVREFTRIVASLQALSSNSVKFCRIKKQKRPSIC